MILELAAKGKKTIASFRANFYMARSNDDIEMYRLQYQCSLLR